MHLEIGLAFVTACEQMHVHVVNPVRRNRQPLALRDFCHAYPRRYAAERCRVRLWKVDMPVVHEMFKFVDAVQVLAGGNGNPRFPPESCVPF